VSTAEGVVLWIAIGAYALAFAALVAHAFFRRDGLRRAGDVATAVAVASHAVTLAVHWVATGHAPVQGTYENSLAGAFFLPVLFFAAVRRFPAARRAAPLVLAATLLLVGNGVQGGAEHRALEPPFRSNWLVVHVTFAWLAFGSYLVASALAGHFLWITRRAAPVPEPDRRGAVDELAARLIGFGFVADSVMIASGAIWAHGLWGRYWAWDPIETWSLVSWLVYGVNLHLRFTLGWSGRRAAWVAVLSVATIVVTFFGIGVVSDVHTMLL
jgi:cytochrome c-type biogenesis protein CcsB